MDVDAYQQDVVSVLDGDGTSMRCLGDMAEGGSMTSSMSSDVKLRRMVPSSTRVMARRFSTVSISQRESS